MPAAQTEPVTLHRRLGSWGVTVLLLWPLLAAAAAGVDNAAATTASSAAALFAEHCANCHERGDKSGGPLLTAMAQMSSAQIAFALERGKMREQAQGLSQKQRAAVVAYVAGGGSASRSLPETAWCRPGAPPATINTERVPVSRWGLDDANTRYQPHSSIRAANVAQLQLAWSFGLPQVAEARAQPVISADTVFVLAVSGFVFALDRASGCIKWRTALERPLRTALTLGQVGTTPALFFGDSAATVTALHASTGKRLWQVSAALFDTSITTAAPAQHGNRLYVPLSAFDVAAAVNPEHECCKGHGAVLALDSATGQQLWVRHLTAPAQRTHQSSIGVQQWGPSGVPVWNTPNIDAAAGLLYVGTGENTSSPATALSDSVLALDMETGSIRWHFQATAGDAFNMACGRRAGPNCPQENGPDYDFGAAIVRGRSATGAAVLFAGQKSGVVHALNAADGTLRWQRQLSQGTVLGGVHWGMALAGRRLFVPIADPELPRPGYTPRPGLYALDAATGEVLWTFRAQRNCDPVSGSQDPWPECPFAYGFSAAPMAANDLVFAGSLDGQVRAFAAANGRVLWQRDTVSEYQSVNGLPTHGGAIDNAGLQLADDMLFVSSGYGMFGQMPGNALLAYRLRPPAPQTKADPHSQSLIVKEATP